VPVVFVDAVCGAGVATCADTGKAIDRADATAKIRADCRIIKVDSTTD